MMVETTPYNNTTIALPATSSSSSDSLPWWFRHVLPLLIITFGVIGNTLTAVMLHNKKYAEISTCYYMKALAWTDNFVLLLFLIRWMSKLPNSPIERDTYFCVLYFFFVRFGFGISAWTLMFMTFDRYISVRFPLHAKRLCTINRARLSLLAIALVHIISHLPYFWRYANPKGVTLTEKCPFNIPEKFNDVYKILRMVIFDRLLPWLLILSFTIAMSVELYRDVKNKEARLGKDATDKKVPKRVTAMSLIVAWVFFMFTFPTSVYEGIRTFSKNEGIKISVLLYEIFVYLLYFNSAMNFYLYIIVARKFREDFKKMIMQVINRRRQLIIHTSSSIEQPSL